MRKSSPHHFAAISTLLLTQQTFDVTDRSLSELYPHPDSGDHIIPDRNDHAYWGALGQKHRKKNSQAAKSKAQRKARRKNRK